MSSCFGDRGHHCSFLFEPAAASETQNTSIRTMNMQITIQLIYFYCVSLSVAKGPRQCLVYLHVYLPRQTSKDPPPPNIDSQTQWKILSYPFLHLVCQEHGKFLPKQILITLGKSWSETKGLQVIIRCGLPGMVPREELSKNCLGQFLDSSSEDSPTSKNLLLGKSSTGILGDSSSFLGEFRLFFGVTKTFLGEQRLGESTLIGRPLLVGVQGNEGSSTSAFCLTLSLMALFFHLFISAVWLETKLWRRRELGWPLD